MMAHDHLLPGFVSAVLTILAIKLLFL